MFEVEYVQYENENTAQVENMTFASRKVCWLFYGIPTGSMLLEHFLRELHSTHHDSSMETWSPCLRNSSRLGGMQGEENRSYVLTMHLPTAQGRLKPFSAQPAEEVPASILFA
jgi:hypothetical protein